MTTKQYEVFEKIRDYQWGPSFGFDGAIVISDCNINKDTNENDVNFTIHVFSPCFDCERDECDDHNKCDSYLEGYVNSDGIIHVDGEIFNNADELIQWFV